MSKAVDFMKRQGAEIININEISSADVGGYSFQVMLYEYKDGLNKYFRSWDLMQLSKV